MALIVFRLKHLIQELKHGIICTCFLGFRSSSCLVAMKGRLYVLGGFNGQFLKSVEMYDPRANSWELVADMTMTRVHFGASVV